VIFVPVVLLMLIGFGLSLKKYLADMHAEALDQGKTDIKELDFKGFIPAVKKALPTILKHDKFSECTENRERATAHLMVFYSFIGLFIVTGIFFIVLDVFHIPGPYRQINPVKWLANVSGIVLVIGSVLMIRNRLAKTDQVSAYKDWLLLGLVLGVGLTGLLTEAIRLAGGAFFSYFFYFVHLTLVFILFISLPYSKFAHIVYRSLAMVYTEYIGRK
jgi:quinone-modifying oxidoreductase subunit QmoC